MKIFRRVFFASFLLTVVVHANAQWQIVKRLGSQSFRTINVEVPPSSEERAPIIMSSSFVDDLHGWAACDDGTLLQTIDGGTSWKRREISPKVNQSMTMFFHSIGVFFTSKSTGWIIAQHQGKSTILKTTDGGKQWKVNYKAKTGAFHNIWFVNAKVGWVVGEFEDRKPYKSGGLILGTKDGGKTWQTQYRKDGEESFLHEIRFSNERIGWAVGDDAIFYSADGGNSWTKQKGDDIDSYLFGLDVLSSEEAWAVGAYGRVLHTTNRGRTWEEVKLSSELETPWLDSVRFIDKNRGWIAGNDGLILATVDGGKSWKVESKGESSYWRDLIKTKQHIFAFGNDGLIFRRKI